jgi:phosphoserine/homoserine phosphotransferase
MIIDYKLRQKDPKKKTAEALQGMNYQVIGMGDSYNDVSMLRQAEVGILFRPPENVIRDYPQLPVVQDYEELKKILVNYI